MHLQRTLAVRITFCLAFICLSVRLGLGGAQRGAEAAARVIASVNGDTISYRDIKVPTAKVSKLFSSREKRPRVMPGDKAEFERLRHELDVRELKTHIIVAIRRQVRSELKVRVSDDEVTAYIQDLMDNPDPSSTPEALRAENKRLLTALEAVYLHSEDPDDVYKRLLANEMSPKIWELNLEYYKTPERRELLSRPIEDEPIIDDGTRAGVREGLLMRKTDDAIAQLLRTTDPKVKSKPYNFVEIKRYEWWQKRLHGFFTERQYVDDILDGSPGTTAQLNNRLRLDRPGTPFVDGAPHVVLETKMTPTVYNNAKIQRSSGYSTGSADEFVENLDYPNSGNGFALSKDGYNVPETTTPPTQMSAGEELGVPDTIMRCKFDDGRPYPQTIGTQTSSDWALREVVPGDPTFGYQWEPYP